MIPTHDLTEEEKLWKKLMTTVNEAIFEGYFPTIAELSRWLQACEGNYSTFFALLFWYLACKLQNCNFSTESFYFGRLWPPIK